MAESLQELRESSQACLKCSLGETRTNVVFGVGDDHADLMFVGEAPGFHEDKQGEPFVGAAGQLLDKLLAGIGLTRDRVYIANVLKCRPPNNRDPLPEEVEVCRPLLFEQVKLIGPKVVATLGNHATRLVLGRNVYMSKVHGQVFDGPGYRIFPIFHPAAALYQRTNLTALEEDFAKLKELLENQSDVPPSEPPEKPEQISLF